MLEIIIAAIFIATVFNIILNKFQMPTIIGYIITWTIIAYIFPLQWATSNNDLRTIAEFGIVFLMFAIGLEFSAKHLIKMRKNVFVFWWLQFLITSIVFYLLWIFAFGLESQTALIVSFWLTLSSTAIVLKLLTESWEINKEYWNKSVGILIFQDLIVIPILLLITILSTNDTNIWVLLSKTAISAFILFFILWIFGRFLLDKFLYKVAKTKSNEIFIWSILFIVIWASTLAHFMWFTYSLWAFIAWMLIAETSYKHQVEADLIPFRDLLLGFFFVTVWMQLELNIIYENINIIFIILWVLLFIKIAIIYLILLKSSNKKVALKTALSLFQFWEFGIVIFDLATSRKLLDPNIWQVLVVVIILSMIITPLILKNVDNIVNFIFKNNDKNNKCLENTKLKNHTILIGYWRLWKVISKLFDKNNVKYIIVESFIKAYKEGKKDWKPIIFWNAFQENFLKSINIKDAKNILISVWTNEKLYLIASIIRKMNIQWTMTVKVNNSEEKKMLEELKIKNIIVETEKTALFMTEWIIKKG